MRRYILIYIVLFTLAIPWYWREEQQELLFGLPLWVSVSVMMSALISILTAYLLLKYPWPGEDNNPYQEPKD